MRYLGKSATGGDVYCKAALSRSQINSLVRGIAGSEGQLPDWWSIDRGSAGGMVFLFGDKQRHASAVRGALEAKGCTNVSSHSVKSGEGSNTPGTRIEFFFG